MPLVSLETMFSPCSAFTLGFDQAQRHLSIDFIGMQMKILAGAPNNPISKCMISKILAHVRDRKEFPKNPLGFSGPQLLRKCYLQFPHDTAVTYIDTRGADWPYSGLRAGAKIYAHELASVKRHFYEIVERNSTLEYNDMVKTHKLYHEHCEL